MPYEIVVDEKTGQRRAVVTGSVYKPKEGEEPTGAGPTLLSPMDFYQATRGFTPQGMLESGVKAAGQAVGRGIKELQQTGNLGKATEAAGKEFSQQLQAPAMLSQRVGYNAARDLAQSVLGNLPAAGSRKPGQADSPIFGVLPPLPRIKSTGVAEDVATGFVQGALAWIPAARGVSLAAKGLSMVPGVGAAAQATRTAAAFAESGGVVPRLAVGAAKAVVKGAPTGAVVDALAFTPGEQTMTGQIIDWVEKQAGTPLHGPLVDLLQTKPGDTEAEARWKEAVGGAMVIGPAAEAVIRTTGLAARSLFNLAKVKQAATAMPTPEAPAAVTPSAEAAPVAAPAAAAVEAPTAAPRPSQLEVEEAATQAARAVEDMDAAMSGAVDYGQQVARQVTTPPAAAATTGLEAGLGGIGKGIAEDLRRQMWEAYQAGQTKVAGVEDPNLLMLKQAKERQGLQAQTQDEFNQLLDKAIAYRERQQAAAAAPVATAEVPAVGTPAAAPQADPFAGASRKITETTNENRIQNAAESLASWTAKVGGEPMSIDEALRLVKAKGAILDPDRVPGLDMEAARNDKTKGVSDTPATEAAAAAYRQFYGLEAPPIAATAPAAVQPAAAAKAELPDTRGQGQFFHGAAKEFTLTEGGEYAGDGMNIYGNGFYATEDLKTAAAYQKKNVKAEPVVTMYGAQDELRAAGATPPEINGLLGRGRSEVPSAARLQEISANLRQKANEYPGSNQSGRMLDLANTLDSYKPVNLSAQKVVYRITENQPIKFFDLDAPVSPDMRKRISDIPGYDAARELVDRALEDAPANASLAQIMDEIRNGSKSLEVPAYDVQDIFENLIDSLKAEGYGGFTHEGGRLAGGGKRLHQVRIYWDPAASISLEKVNLEAKPAPAAPAQQAETKALLDKALANVPPEKRAAIQKQMEERGLAQAGDGEQVDFKPLPPEAIDAIGQELTGIIRQIAGEDVGVRFNNAFVIAPKPRAWGGKSANQLSYRKGSYDYFQDIITVNGMGFDTPIGGKVQTAFHEAWHRVQFNFLTSKELRALNSMYAQLRFQAPGPAEEVKLIERQAIAFQRYAYAKRNNLPIAPFVAGASEQELRGLRDGQPIPGLEKAAIKAATVGVQIIDGLVDFAEKVGNVLQNRGWTSTRTIFEQAYSGKLAQTRGGMGNALLMAEEAATLKGRMAAGEQVSTAELQTGIENIRRAKILNELERTNQIQFTDANRGKLFSAGEDVPTGPRPPEPTPGPEDPDWVTSFARLLQDNRDKLLSGEATLEDLYKLNSFQKTQSPSGQQVYTAQSEDLIPGLNAMSQVLPDRATQSGIPSFTAAETVKLNQQWFDRHGENGAAILRGLDTITQGFNAYEHGALNRAMALADLKQAEAQLEAARWLNSVGEPGANASERLAKLMTAADSARRMHLAIMTVTRPWGQLGAEMQLPRNYDIPTATGVVEEAVAPPAPGVSVVDQGIKQELEQADTVYDGLTSKVSPELTEAAQGGEITPKAEADADAIAQTIVSMGTEPKIRAKVWRKLDEVNQMDANALLMLRTNNLISSGITMMTNLTNGIANLGRLTLSQTSGAVLTGDFDRAMYSIQMLGGYLSNLQNGFRVAGHAFKAGQPLFNMEASSLDYLERLAKRDAQGELLQNDPTAMTGWTLNTMNMSQAWAETRPGQALNMLWKTVGTGASRVAITIDAFNSTIAGYSYEHFRHMPRGMELAVERGMKKYSPEAWDYAQQYAAARTDQAIKDAVINGKTLADVAMESPHAQKFMDAVNFTDKIWAELEPRTLDEGMRIGQTRGLKGDELTAFAKKYVDEGFFIHKLADGMLNGPVPLGRIGSLPGEAIQTLSNARLIGPVFKFIQPFQRVPSNILKSAMRSTPAAVFVDTFWRDLTSADAGTRQRAIGEIAVGTGVLTMLTLATTMGYLRINGAGPQDPTAREKWMRDRQMPYSIQHWDQDNARWSAPVSLASMEPFATLFGAVGDYNDVAASLPTESRNRLGSALALSLVRMQTSGLLSKTYFQGINELYEAAFDPAKTFAGPAQRDPFARYLQRIIASMVPYSSALRAARRQVDPVARSVEPSEAGGAWGFWQETWDEIRNAVPGYSQGLPARRDWTLPGAPPMVLPGVIGTGMIDEDAPFLAAMMQFAPWSAFRVGRPIEDPVQREMAELHGKGSTFSGPRASDFGPEMRLTPGQLAQYQEAFGSVKDEFGRTWHQAVTELINSAEYQAMPIEPPSTQQVSFRAAFIQQEIQKYKELAKQLFMGTTTKGAEIERNKLMLQGRQDEMNFYRRYGVSGASRSTDAQTFAEEMNR